MCNHCDGKGIIRVCYHDGSPTEYAVCLCSAARWFRSDTNANRRTGFYGWQVWAAANQVQPEKIAMLEDMLEDAELKAMGFGQPVGTAEEDELAAIGRRKGKL